MLQLRTLKVLALAVAGLAASACVTTSTLHPAKTIGAGTGEFVLAPGAQNLAGLITLPDLELYYRRGLTDYLDLGVKVFPFAAGIDVNVKLVDIGKFVLSVDPTITGEYFSASNNGNSSSFFIGQFMLPVLMDVVRAGPFVLTLGPKIGYLYTAASETAAAGGNSQTQAVSNSGMMYGSSIATRFQIGQTFAITPEFSLLYIKGITDPFYNANLGFAF